MGTKEVGAGAASAPSEIAMIDPTMNPDAAATFCACACASATIAARGHCFAACNGVAALWAAEKYASVRGPFSAARAAAVSFAFEYATGNKNVHSRRDCVDVPFPTLNGPWMFWSLAAVTPKLERPLNISSKPSAAGAFTINAITLTQSVRMRAAIPRQQQHPFIKGAFHCYNLTAPNLRSRST